MKPSVRKNTFRPCPEGDIFKYKTAKCKVDIYVRRFAAHIGDNEVGLVICMTPVV
jgi:hypothetical protein